MNKLSRQQLQNAEIDDLESDLDGFDPGAFNAEQIRAKRDHQANKRVNATYKSDYPQHKTNAKPMKR